jgi:hypothetical protein
LTTYELVDLLIATLLALLVYDDARKRDWSEDGFRVRPMLWALCVFVFWIIVLPLYLLRRRKRPLLASVS